MAGHLQSIRTNLNVLASQGAVFRSSDERICTVFEVGLLECQLAYDLAVNFAKATSFFR